MKLHSDVQTISINYLQHLGTIYFLFLKIKKNDIIEVTVLPEGIFEVFYKLQRYAYFFDIDNAAGKLF